MLSDKRDHGLEYHPVLRVIEAGRVQLFQSLVHALRLEQHGAEDGLFHVKSLRRLIAYLKPYLVEVDPLVLPA